MGNAVLKITDGTSGNTVDLLSPRFGYLLCNWEPARPELDLTMNKNWFSGVETPANVVQKPAVEVFTLNARHTDVDRLSDEEKKLNRILYLANLYWTKSRAVEFPFYLVAKNRDESSLRYAVIFSAQLHNDSNPYSSPFFSIQPASVDLVVPITRGEWLDYPPGTGGVTMYENVTSTIDSTVTLRNQGIHFINDDARIPIANILTHAGISHIFKGTSKNNLIDVLPEFDGYSFLEGYTPSHVTYFGMEKKGAANVATGYSFPGIHFNITTPAELSSGDQPYFNWKIVLETSPGVLEWVNLLGVEDGTNGLTKPGTVLFLAQNLPMVEHTVNGVRGYWVQLSPGTTLSQLPLVSVKHPAVPVLPYFDVFLTEDDFNPILQPEHIVVKNVRGQDHKLVTEALVYEDADAAAGNTPFNLTFDVYGASSSPSRQIESLSLEVSTTKHTATYYGALVSDNGHRVKVNFSESGAYNIYQSAWDDEGRLYEATFRCIHKVEAPVAKYFLDFIVPHNQIDASAVIFQPKHPMASFGGDSIASSVFEWGDGTQTVYPGPGFPPLSITHTYPGPGYYSPTYRMIMTSGAEVWVTKKDLLYWPDTYTTFAGFTSSSRRGYVPFNPGFDGSPSEGSGALTYAWDFGDGTTGTGVKPGKIYTEKGVYSVMLTVTDEESQNTVTYKNYIYVDNEELRPGDNGIFLDFSFRPTVSDWTYGSSPNKIYIGGRSLVGDNSEHFYPIIAPYAANLGNPNGVIFGRNGFVDVDTVENTGSYTGYVYERIMDPAESPAVGEEEIFTRIGFGPDVYKRYTGHFRMFLRMGSDTSLAREYIYFSAGIASVTPTLDTVYSLNRTRRVSDALGPSYVTVLDLGSISIGGDFAVTQNLDILWQINGTKSSQKVWLYDVVLIPQDEWFAELSFPDYLFQYGQYHEISIGSITYDGRLNARITKDIPKTGGGFDSRIEAIPSVIPGTPLATVGKDMRFTMFTTRYNAYLADFDPTIPAQLSSFYTFMELSNVKKVNRYFGARGSF